MYEDIKEQYNQLLNSKKALSEDEVLNILIKIENSIKHNFLRNLPNSGTGYSMDEVRELIEIFKNENPNQKRKIIEDAERETLY